MECPFSVILCHGSYHTPEPYQPFLTALKAAGIDAHCPQLPSSDPRGMNIGDLSNPDYDRDPPPNGYSQPADDVKVVKEILEHLITKSGDYVILVGHSSGAFTATMAAVPELQATTRKAKGDSGGIIGIFYECGFLIPVGESVNSFFQPKDGSGAVVPPYCRFHVRSPTDTGRSHGASSDAYWRLANEYIALEKWLQGPREHGRRCQILFQRVG